MRKYLTSLIVAGSIFSSLATDARIETMGGTDHFFKDDWSIYRNPATIGDYDRMLIGSFGIYTETDDNVDANTQVNRDAKKPYFGGTVSFSKDEETPSKFILGAVFNRYDDLLKLVLPEYKDGIVTNNNFLGYPQDKEGLTGETNGVEYLKETVGKMDLLVGYTLNNGLTIGLGGYLAFQSEKIDEADGAMTRVVKGNLGVAGSVSDNMDIEASIGLAAITLIGRQSSDGKKDSRTVNTMSNEIGFSIDARVFADAPSINGAFVPHIQANIISISDDKSIVDFNGGLGINAHIDRGFIWGGLEGFFYDHPSKIIDSTISTNDFGTDTIPGTGVVKTPVNQVGGKVAFGIERNVLTDWLIWRVGATKVLAYESFDGGDKGSQWIENHEDDHVSFGLGVNIEDRFKIDAVVAENILYTFSNLFSGNSHHFSSRISATFNF